MDLIRELLLKLEALEIRPGGVTILYAEGAELSMDGYNQEQIEYHLSLIREVGFIEGAGSNPMRGISFRRLTWAGHDYLDAVRDPEVWAKTRDGALAAGGFTFDLLKDLAKGFIKKQIEQRTGISL